MFDHQKVRVMGITWPSDEAQDWMEDAEDLIASCARVSNPDNQDNPEYQKLMSYLADNNHWSPFEMASATLEIETTRDIARQILRHRSFSFQEFSQRYSSEIGDFIIRDARSQDLKNRQNSNDDMSVEDKQWFENVQISIGDHIKQQYEAALKRGIAKEQARSILPEGMTPSRLYMNGTFRSWKHYIDLRSANGTQLEHQDIAIKCRKVLNEYAPNIF